MIASNHQNVQQLDALWRLPFGSSGQVRCDGGSTEMVMSAGETQLNTSKSSPRQLRNVLSDLRAHINLSPNQNTGKAGMLASVKHEPDRLITVHDTGQ